MVVQHNMTAMNANRMLGLTTAQQSKATEKLSSGYRINRAADDAAGLSISEKMRKQINGLDRASTNAEDGVSAVQTAEGALNEVQDMLQRMNELAVQAANGTNSENDRSYLQSEIDQLVTEIDRVSETTKFNETYLLKGDGVGGKYVELGTTNTTATNSISITGQTEAATGRDYSTDRDVQRVAKNTILFGSEATDSLTVAGTSYQLKDYADLEDLTNAISSNSKVNSVDIEYKNNVCASKGTTGNTNFSLTHTNKSSTVSGTVTFKVASNTTKAAAGKSTITIDDKQSISIQFTLATKIGKNGNVEYDEATTNQNIKSALKAQNISYTESDGVFAIKLGGTVTVNAATKVDDLTFDLHVGADSSSANKIGVRLASMSADGLGVSGISVSSERNATNAIDVIANAIQMVSKQRSDLGAVQNRLEHTINNLDNIVENTTAAESRIRDTDMAKQMVEFSNLNILAQAGQSMLSQANQSNQGVLSLLK